MGAFKVRALIVSMGGLQLGKDVKLTRGAANRLDLAAGDTFYLPATSIINGVDGRVRLPRAGTSALGTTNTMATANDGDIRLGYKAGSAQIGFVINGTALIFSVPITGNGGALVCTVNPAGG